MVRIGSEYPEDDELFVRIDYFKLHSPCEGGILIVGKDIERLLEEYRG